MRLKEKAKDDRKKQKDGEEQYEEQQLNLCGEFFRTRLNNTVNKNNRQTYHAIRKRQESHS